jgi:hypothetical protein
VIFLPGQCDAGQRVCPLSPQSSVFGGLRWPIAPFPPAGIFAGPPFAFDSLHPYPIFRSPFFGHDNDGAPGKPAMPFRLKLHAQILPAPSGSPLHYCGFPIPLKTLLIARVTVGNRQFSGTTFRQNKGRLSRSSLDRGMTKPKLNRCLGSVCRRGDCDFKVATHVRWHYPSSACGGDCEGRRLCHSFRATK